MSLILFTAVVTGAQTSGYHARFHDLPDCTAEGRDLPDLLTHARQALAARLDAIANAGEDWPKPTPIEEIAPVAGSLLIPVDIAVDDPPIRVNVSLGERLVQRLDAAAEARGMTRSGFIAQSVRTALGETARPGEYDIWGRRLQDELNALGRKINDSIGPESAFTRRMNEIDEMALDGVRRAADAVSGALRRKDGGKSTASSKAEATASSASEGETAN